MIGFGCWVHDACAPMDSARGVGDRSQCIERDRGSDLDSQSSSLQRNARGLQDHGTAEGP
jgi:hypothetical protein